MTRPPPRPARPRRKPGCCVRPSAARPARRPHHLFPNIPGSGAAPRVSPPDPPPGPGAPRARGRWGGAPRPALPRPPTRIEAAAPALSAAVPGQGGRRGCLPVPRARPAGGRIAFSVRRRPAPWPVHTHPWAPPQDLRPRQEAPPLPLVGKGRGVGGPVPSGRGENAAPCALSAGRCVNRDPCARARVTEIARERHAGTTPTSRRVFPADQRVNL
jgi:hypothetical protein